VTLREKVVLEPLEAADRLSGQTPDFCKLTADWSSLGADAFTDGVLDPARQGGLELGGELGERLHLGAGTLERGVHVALGGTPFGSLIEPLPRPCHCCFVHGRGR
jgi:hypothetical protein